MILLTVRTEGIYDAKCSEKHWPTVSLYHVVETATTYFTYCVSMDYSMGGKRVFSVAEERVDNICPTCHLGIVPYACLALVFFSSLCLVCGTFQLSKSTLDL